MASRSRQPVTERMVALVRCMMREEDAPAAMQLGLHRLIDSAAAAAALLIDADGAVIAAGGAADATAGARLAAPGGLRAGVFPDPASAGLHGDLPPLPVRVLALEQSDAAPGHLVALGPAPAQGATLEAVADAVALVRDLFARRDPLGAFAPVFLSSPLPMWVYAVGDLRFLRVNPAAERSYGWSAADFAAMTLLDIRPPEDRAAIRDLAARRPEDVWSGGPFRHLDARGALRHVDVDVVPLDYGGAPARLATLRCVTDRVEAEQAMREAQRIARLATWQLDLRGRSLGLAGSLAAPWQERANRPQRALRHLLRSLDPADRASLGIALRRCVDEGSTLDAEFRLRGAGDEVMHCRVTGAMRPGPTPILHGYVQDVTAERAAEAALRQTDRLSAMGQLTGGIAHDFNNLLTVIGVNLQLVREAVDAPELRGLLSAAAAAVERGGALTGQLLSFAGRQPQRPASIDVDGFLAEFCAMVGRSLAPDHDLDISGVEPGLCVACDPTQFETALLNLVLNARDALPDGGAIALHADLRHDPESLPSGRYVALAVRDGGIGMAPEVAQRVTEPFFTTKPAGRGTGLGLSMAFGFVEQSGGCLTIDTAPGCGTTVTLILPAAAPAALEAPCSSFEQAPPPLEVFVVEDEPSVCAVAVGVLERIGARVKVAATAEEALAAIAEGASFDILFTDIMLGPGLDGFALARRVLAARPGIGVVFASGYHHNPAARTKDPRLARWELLHKPYDISALRAAIARAAAARGCRAGAEG